MGQIPDAMPIQQGLYDLKWDDKCLLVTVKFIMPLKPVQTETDAAIDETRNRPPPEDISGTPLLRLAAAG